MGMECFGSDTGVSREERIANARLIAESPLLLDALQPFAEAALEFEDTDDDRNNIWESPAAMNITVGHLRAARAARAAIAKALGQ